MIRAPFQPREIQAFGRCHATATVLVLYVAVYAVLSLSGGYVFTQSGQVRYGFGLSVSDLQQWQPRGAFCQRFQTFDGSWILRADFLGYVFAPLVLLDQTLVHKTVRLNDPETGAPIGNPGA